MSTAAGPRVLQLDATPTTWLATTYDVRGGHAGIARVRFRGSTETVRVDVAGRRYLVRRDGSPGSFALERRGRVIARAAKPSDFARALAIDFRGDRWELRARPMRRAFRVIRRGRRVAEVAPAAWYKRHARLTSPEGLPEEVGYFLVVLVLLWWRRRRSA